MPVDDTFEAGYEMRVSIMRVQEIVNKDEYTRHTGSPNKAIVGGEGGGCAKERTLRCCKFGEENWAETHPMSSVRPTCWLEAASASVRSGRASAVGRSDEHYSDW